MNARKILNSFLDLFVPERCILCGGYLSFTNRVGAYPVCEECSTKIRVPSGNRCTLCSLPLISEIDICMECRGKTYSFEHNHSFGVYGEEIKELISCYKTGKIRSLGELFAEILSKAYFERYPGLPVVPVPSRPSSVRKRGFDQMLVICEIFRKRYGIPVLSCLKRGGGDREQKTLNREERKKNLLGSIGVSNKIKPPFPKTLVLLDDVFTTGATVNECAGILKTQGVLQVFSLTLARD